MLHFAGALAYQKFHYTRLKPHETETRACFNETDQARRFGFRETALKRVCVCASLTGMDKHTQKPKQTQVSVSPMKRTNMSLCVFM